MKQAGLAFRILALLGALFAYCAEGWAATDGMYTISEAAAVWDGTEASRAKAPTADYDYTYGDESSVSYTLPWAFNFYGVEYSRVTVDTNGNVWFDPSITAPNATIAGFAHSFNLSGSGRGPVIAAWNNDLSSYYYGGVFIQHKTDGPQGDRVVIEWQAETYSEEGYNNPNNFEVVLFRNGDVRIDYNNFTTAVGNDFGSGLSGNDGLHSLNLSTIYDKPFRLAGKSFFFARLYNISASTNGNGTISPTTATTSYEASSTFAITPAAGYKLTSLTDNGVDVSSSVTNNSYTITSITTNHFVVASFDRLILARIPGKGDYPSLQAAYDVAADGDIILVPAEVFVENFTANRPISVTLEGGYNSDYSLIWGVTVIVGQPRVSSGTVKMKNVRISK